MARYTASEEIDAEPDVVFGYLADIERHGEWSADPLEITRLAEDQFRSVATSKGKTITAEIVVIERRSPERLVFEATDLTGRWRHTFTLDKIPSGTRVEREISGSLGPAQMLLFWLVVGPIKRPNARRALSRLKARIETVPR